MNEKIIIECPSCSHIQIVEVKNELPFSSYLYKCSECRNTISEPKLYQMPAISVRQPWAYLLCSGIKDVENRTWKLPKKYVGKRVLIHAGAKNEPYFTFNWEQSRAIDCIPDDHKFKTSAIIGSVVFTDCVRNYKSIWAEKTLEVKSGTWIDFPEGIIWNWVASDPIIFDASIPCKGKLSFFTPILL